MRNTQTSMVESLLVIEDNPADLEMVKEWSRATPARLRLSYVTDGQEALDWLKSARAANDLPSLLLLDINLPKLSGIELLVTLKQDERLKKIPVVMFTSSDADSDVQRCYGLHANAYVVKSMDLGRLFASLDDIVSFWLHTAKLSGSQRD